MRVLSKIKRRADGDELPKRGHLVEMDLFDTDRNPLDLSSSTDLWVRHDYDRAVAFPVTATSLEMDSPLLGPVDLVVERSSLAVAFIGATFDISGTDPAGTKYIYMRLQANKPGDLDYTVAYAYTEANYVSNGSGGHFRGYAGSGAVGWSVIPPGTYEVRLWMWRFAIPGDTPAEYTITECAASIALLPAGLADMHPFEGAGV